MMADTTRDAIEPRLLMEIIGVQTAIAQQGLDLGAVMALAAYRAQALTGATGAVIEMAEGDEMVYRSVAGSAESMLGLRLDRHRSLSGLCVAQNRILHCTDAETDERVDREACRRVGLRSMLVVPLCHLGASVGVLKVLSSQAGGFSDVHARTLGLMSDMIGAAMANAARYDTHELYRRATQDPLTGVGNRSLFYDRLRQAIAHAQARGERVGVLNLDMDGLKPINDHHGHQAGDSALCELATRLTGLCRASDTVARVGGDEFGVVLAAPMNRAATRAMRERIAERLCEPLAFKGHDLAIGASVGEALFPDDATDVQELLAVADAQMYEVKRARKQERAVLI
jgi:diguanylate cyclase (GGDEF)-like protein